MDNIFNVAEAILAAFGFAVMIKLLIDKISGSAGTN